MEINPYVEFEQIVQRFAVSEKPLRERITENMATAFPFMIEQHFPTALRDEFRWLKEAASKPDLGGQSPESFISRAVTLAFQLATANEKD
jgi:hypothetical protein